MKPARSAASPTRVLPATGPSDRRALVGFLLPVLGLGIPLLVGVPMVSGHPGLGTAIGVIGGLIATGLAIGLTLD